MKGERITRFASQVQSALAIEAQKRQERRQAHEQGHVSIDVIPQDQEITLMVQPGFRECLDTRVFNQSVTRKWVEDPNPREDAWRGPINSPQPSRLDPSA